MSHKLLRGKHHTYTDIQKYFKKKKEKKGERTLSNNVDALPVISALLLKNAMNSEG